MMTATPRPTPERRHDELLRHVVDQCLGVLEQQGFEVERRGNSGEHSWVQLRCPARDGHGQDGALMLLVAHGRREHTVMVDAYFVDAALGIHTPRRKLLHRYAPETELPGVVREVVTTVSSWRA
jgi:hypothetical protein